MRIRSVLRDSPLGGGYHISPSGDETGVHMEIPDAKIGIFNIQ